MTLGKLTRVINIQRKGQVGIQCRLRNAGVQLKVLLDRRRCVTRIEKGRTARCPWHLEAEAGVSSSSGDPQEYDSSEEEDELPDPNKVFPRIKERDPYRVLGVSSSASYEEVQEAKKYLVEEYRGHAPSVETIEIAHDKIISQNFKERRQEGIKLNPSASKKQLPVEEEPEGRFSQFLDTKVAKAKLRNTCIVFVSVIAWTILTALESEPTAQITVGLLACTYFVQQKRQEKAGPEDNVFWGSVGTAIVATAAGWIVGNVVPVVFPIFPERINIGSICTLIALVAQWFASTYLK